MTCAVVVLHRLAHDDEKALPQHSHAVFRCSRDEFEFALGHFDQRCRVPEVFQEPAIDDAHVMVAAERREVPPLLEADALRRRRLPIPLGIEQRAERRERKPPARGTVRTKRTLSLQRPRRSRTSASPASRGRARRDSCGTASRRSRCRHVPAGGNPATRAPARSSAQSGPMSASEAVSARVPQLDAAIARERPRAMSPARFRNRRQDQPVRQLECGHITCRPMRGEDDLQKWKIPDATDDRCADAVRRDFLRRGHGERGCCNFATVGLAQRRGTSRRERRVPPPLPGAGHPRFRVRRDRQRAWPLWRRAVPHRRTIFPPVAARRAKRPCRARPAPSRPRRRWSSATGRECRRHSAGRVPCQARRSRRDALAIAGTHRERLDREAEFRHPPPAS